MTPIPSERAALALQNAEAMCDLLNDARCSHFPGYWEGSAYRYHPCGIIVGTIKFTNHWNTNNYCDIIITDGTGWDRNICRSPAAYGNPYPKPIDGIAIPILGEGRWRTEVARENLEAQVLAILTQAAEFVQAASVAADQRRREEDARRDAELAQRTNAAYIKALNREAYTQTAAQP